MIERPELARDERFKTNLGRSQHRHELLPQLRAELLARPRKLLLARLAAVGIPCGEVLGVIEALQSPRAVNGGLVTAHPHPVTGSAHLLAPPYRLDGQRPPIRHVPPTLGEDTGEILGRMLGVGPGELAILKQQGVV